MNPRKYFHFLLPEPKHKPPGNRPHKRLEGPYLLHREPHGDTIVLVEPPDPDDESLYEKSFELGWFETETFLLKVLRIEEEKVNRIMDAAWNFYHVAFAIDIEYPLILREAPPGSNYADGVPHDLLRRLGADPLADKDTGGPSIGELVVDASAGRKKVKGIERG